MADIALKASGIVGELQNLMANFDISKNDYAKDMGALQRVSTTIRDMKDCLDSNNESPAITSTPQGAFKWERYTDATLEKAKKLAAAITDHAVDVAMAGSMLQMRAAQEAELPEKRALDTICEATKRINKELAALDDATWASRVCANISVIEQDSKGKFDGGLPMGFRIGRRDSTQDVGGSRRGSMGHGRRDSPSSTRDTSKSPPRHGRSPGNSRPTSREGASPEQYASELDEFSVADIKRFQTAFKRFKVPDTMELHTDDVTPCLDYLGHMMVTKDITEPLFKQVTGFDYFDFDEFLTFLALFIPQELGEFRKVFDKYDENQNGMIDVDEVRKLLIDLGYLPIHETILEAFSIANPDNHGQLNFRDFVTFLTFYRKYEGFSTKQVAEMQDIFSRSVGEHGDTMPVSLLANSLVQVYGVHVASIAHEMEDNLMTGRGMHKSVFGDDDRGAKSSFKAEGLSFSEFLVLARKTREAACERLKIDCLGDGPAAVFAFSDERNGKICADEVRLCLQAMGYTALRQNLDEILREVDKDGDRQLEFAEFFDFMLLYKQREGFRKSDLEWMRYLFHEFDADKNNELDALELAEIIRELGYRSTLDEIRVLLQQVDINSNQLLDFPEFMRLMRLHRENELKGIMQVFLPLAGHERGLIPGNAVRCALEGMGYKAPKGMSKDRTRYNFDSFVEIVDQCRAAKVKAEKKKAGFSDAKIEHFLCLFTELDRDNCGIIAERELRELLREFDWEPKTVQDQQSMVKKIEQARLKAEAVVGGSDRVAAGGSNGVTFWTMVQLFRVLETERDKEEQQRMNSLREKLNFTQKEVEDFRMVYVEKRKAIAKESECEHMPDGLPRSTIRRLLYLIGVEVKGEKKVQLDKELDRVGCIDEGRLDFFGFLELMRFVLDSGWFQMKVEQPPSPSSSVSTSRRRSSV